MSNKIQSALEARKKRLGQNSTSEHDSKIQTALNTRNKRIQSTLPDVLTDINKRYQAEVEAYNSVTMPSFGKNALKDTLDSQRQNKINVEKLKSDINAYRSYLNDETVDELISNLDQISKGYDQYLNIADVYSNFETEEEYEAALKQYEVDTKYTEKYGDMSYGELKSILVDMEEGTEEYTWLSEYAPSKMTVSDYDSEISETDKEIEALKGQIGSSDRRTHSQQKAYDDITGQIDTLEAKKEELEAGKWNLENAEKYGSYSKNADFAEKSVNTEEEPTAGFGIGLGKDWIGVGDPRYDYINNIDGTRLKAIVGGSMSGSDPYFIYNYMTDDEVSTYNYIHNTEGKKASKEYLDYLEFTLNERQMGKSAKMWEDIADEHPILASAISVPATLISGVGAIDVAFQNLSKNITEAVTGEYAGPIDYNTPTMGASVANSTIRGTVSKNVADSTGVIQFDEEKNPILSKLFNGKSLGDVYQLGMSMVDSAAIAGLSALTGGTNLTALLGGSAASQGILDAAANGATDEQALMMGILAGGFETLFEKYELEHLLGADKNLVKAIANQALTEGIGEGATTISNTLADIIVMAENSEWQKNIEQYKAKGLSDSEAIKEAFLDACVQVGWDFIGGMVSGGIFGGSVSAIQAVANENAEYKAIYGDSIAELVSESLEVNPDNPLATKIQKKLDSEKNVSGSQIKHLVRQNEADIRNNDTIAIKGAVASRFSELGETGDIEALSSAITKLATGEKLSQSEQQIIHSSKYGSRVVNELNIKNIKEGGYSADWTGEIGTDRINPEEYSRLIEAEIENKLAETTDDGTKIAHINTEDSLKETATTVLPEEETTSEGVLKTSAPDGKSSAAVTEEETEDPKVLSLADVSGKYGIQAAAVESVYNLGGGSQDISQFNSAFKIAYDFGYSGVSFDYVKNSEVTAYLTDSQKELAYKMGTDVSDREATEKDSLNKQLSNGNVGFKKGGVVRGEGVTVAELKRVAHDTRGTAYKALSTIAKVTGIDIVLYKSVVFANGDFIGEQGKYNGKKEPGTIYIDINAGLKNVKSVDDLAKYALLRTFSHEFTHFIENWNPIRYNEFRKLVFDTLESRGENVNDLIEAKQEASANMSYDAASREVVAEAMTDILPDSKFIEALAKKHNNIFRKLLEKLKEFAENIKKYFASLGHNRSAEANALKEELDGALHYVESIVEMFDKIAVEAVESYQTTVAIHEVKAETETATEAKKDTSEHGFTVTENLEYGTLEIAFENKPNENVRNVLKDNKFRWHRQKAVWYGRADKASIVDAINSAYEAEETESQVNENIEEVKKNGENADNDGAVHESNTDRQRDSRVLDEVEAENVQGDAQERHSVGDTAQRGRKTLRDDSGADAQRISGGPSEGNSESRDLRRDDGLTHEEELAAQSLHEEVTEQIAQQSTEKPKGSNFVIGESLDLPKGEKARYKANIDAIRLVKKLEAEGRYATESEQTVLSKYVGWGGLANAFDDRKTDWVKEFSELKGLLTEEEYTLARGSTLNAHYTDISVIKAMYDGLKQLGFSGGRMLEPSSGTGNFVGAMPTDMSSLVKSWTMVELDSITGLIAKHLYPNADVRIEGFEKTKIPDNYMDVAISNVPFGNYPITDKAYPKAVTSAIHNYFFAKTLDKVRPGGIVIFITSSYTLNSKDNAVRRYIMKHADLLGAIRLPDNAFKGNAGTEVVTDILILKKRAANTDYKGENFLEATWQYIDRGNGAYINSYFDGHPEMVLGTASMEGGMYRGNSLTYKALEGKGSLADQIREAFKNITVKMDYPAKPSPEKTNFAVERAEKKTKENGYVSKGGKIYQNLNGELTEKNVPKNTAERITGLLNIRDAAKKLMNYQQQGLIDAEIRTARRALNKAYDDFVKKFGFINAPINKKALDGDPDIFSILALEDYDSKKKTATKSDIFSKNTITPNRTVTSAKDVTEGLIVSRNETGGVDVPLIARLTGKTENEVTRELIDSRQAFKNRDGFLEAAEVYLSGNVRAKLRDAEALVSLDADYAKNVEALKAVIPEDVPYTDIFVNPGTPWIPSSVYSDFAAYMLGTNNYGYRKAVDVTRNNETGNFTVEVLNKYLKSTAFNTQKWGTPKRSFLELFDAMLNSRSVVVKYKTSDGQTVVDTDATAAANEKIENIKKEFGEWLWKDESRRTELATLYNEVFNSVVTPKYNGDNLTVNGANALKPLRPHQRNAVQRVVSSGGNTLLAHKVGAGKTYEMAAAAMKLKQLGLVNKPMFAVPKSLVSQWGKEFMDFFPTAKLLVAEASDFTAANRKVFANRIATGSYDAIILSYEQFEKLPISDDFARGLYQEQIDSIIRAIEETKAEKGEKSLSVKDLEKKRKSLQAKIDKLTDKAKDEDNIEFEELGVDSLFIDEAHNFKNLFYTTSMNNVSGLGNKDGSKRAFDLYTKVRYLQQLNGGKGIVFATATPVMNSMSEMYIMQKYLQPDLLNQLGLSTFDAWAKQFGEVVNGVEIKPSGQGYRVKQSFSRFKNMSELQLLFRNFADVLTDIPGLKIPKMKGGKVNVVVCEPGQFQQDFMKELEKRADNIKNVDPSIDNMLKITSDGRKISYTQRMIDPSLPYEEGCKIFRCADNVIRVYKESKDIKGTQLVFCDMATPKGKSKTTSETEDNGMDMESARLYDDMKARLIKGGIKASEIAFIHEADTDDKKKTLFANVNDGKVRVLIGSTGKMGVGMNVQKRVVAIHHLDAPWRPGDVEQRNGRAFRQGNINDEVENFTYVTEGSFDARLWDILERKQSFINQVMNGENVGRETEDTGEVTLSAAEVKALASGNPMIMEQVQLDTDIKKLESLKRSHNASVLNAKQKLEKDKGDIAILERYIANGKADLQARVDTYSEGNFQVTVGNKKFTDKKDVGAALMLEATAKATSEGYTTIGKFAGFDLRVVKTSEGIKGILSGKQGYSFNTYPGNTTHGINHLIAVAEGISEKVKAWEATLTATQKDLAEQEKLSVATFDKQAELDSKRVRYNEIMAILNPPKEQSLDSIDEEAEQHQSRDYLDDTVAKKYNKHSKYNEIETLFMIWSNGSAPVGEVKRFSRFGKYRFYEKTENGCVEISRKQYNERMDFDVKNIDGRAERGISEIVNSDENSEGGQTDTNYSNRDTGGDAEVSGHSVGEQLRNELRRSVSGIRGSNLRAVTATDSDTDNTQYQARTETLTDEEILQYAASNVTVNPAFNDFNEGEKTALSIFRKRLEVLAELKEKRAEQGRIYKEQQFGPKADRSEAAKTLNRMKILDTQIARASDEVLDIESKPVLRNVLKEARRVIETEERKHGNEKLKRWRDRRNNSEAIKKYRTRLAKDVADIQNWILHPSNKDTLKHVPDALKSTVIPFIESINFESKRQLKGGEATKADTEYLNRLEALRKILKNTADTNELYSGYYDLPQDFMDNLENHIEAVRNITQNDSGEFVINQMTAAELQSLSKVVRNLKKLIQNMNKFHSNAMYQHVYEAGDDTIGFLELLGDDNGKTGTLDNFVKWQQMRPAYAFERFGRGGVAIYDGLRRGQGQLAFNTREITEFAEKAYTAKEVKAWEKEVKTIKLGGGVEVKMTVAHIMSFYELSKRPQALMHILGEGVRVATFKEGRKTHADTGHTLTPAEVDIIIKELTPRQKEVADSLQKYMAKQGGKWGNHVTVARFGEEMFGEETYFPINSDGRHLQANADESPSAAALYALLNMGFTKELQEKAKNRIVLYSIFDVFANHMASMAQYNALALPVLDALKWFNYRQVEVDERGNKTVLGSVREQMARTYGTPVEKKPGSGNRGYAESFVMNIIKAFNGTEAQGVPADTFAMTELRRYNMAQIAYNFRVVVQQPLSILRAASIIDYSSMARGLKLSPKEINKNITEMQKYSGIAAWKSLGFYDVNISRGLTDTIKHKSDAFTKIGDVGMWGAEKADLIAWASMWSAAKEEVVRKQKLTAKDEGFYEAVTKLFEDIIYKTQVVDSVLTKNEYMRSKGPIARAVGSFMSEPTTTASMLIDAFDKVGLDMKRGMTRRQALKKNGKKLGRLLYVYGISAIMLAAVQSVSDAFRDDDDYQTFLEKWLEAFGGNFTDEFNPINKLPIFSDVVEVVKEILSVLGVDTYGNPPRSVIMQWYDSLAKGAEILAIKITGEDTDYTWYGGIYKLLQAVSGISGLPMSTATREIVTAWNATFGAMFDLKIKSYEPSEKSEIKYAYADGYLTEEEAVRELLEKGLVDNEDEAYFTIREWENGEGYSRYDAIYNAVRNGQDIKTAMDELLSHGYKEKDVISTVKSQIGIWYKDGEISKQQAIDMLTKYTDLKSEDIEANVQKWSCKVVTGIDFNDIKDEYLDGNITFERAVSMYNLYGGYTKEEATEKVTEWKSLKETGIDYGDIKDEFLDGNITESEAKSMYVTYGGYSSEEANQKVEVLSFVKKYPECDGISYAAIEGYREYSEKAGVSPETFYDAWKYNSSTKADTDKNGEAISGSKKKKVLEYIDSLDLTNKQKDSLYYSFGWAESKLYEAPWR